MALHAEKVPIRVATISRVEGRRAVRVFDADRGKRDEEVKRVGSAAIGGRVTAFEITATPKITANSRIAMPMLNRRGCLSGRGRRRATIGQGVTKTGSSTDRR